MINIYIRRLINPIPDFPQGNRNSSFPTLECTDRSRPSIRLESQANHLQ